MDDIFLFPLADYWWLYAAFTGLVLLLLALDLGVFHREAHVVSFREAAAWSAVWVALSLAFNYALYLYAAGRFPADERLMAIPGFDPAASARQVGLEFLRQAGPLDAVVVGVDAFAADAVACQRRARSARRRHRFHKRTC